MTPRRKWLVAAAGVASGFLCVGFLLLVANFLATFPAFYDYEFHKNDAAFAADLTPAELAAVRDKMISYFAGTTKSLQVQTADGDFYTADEISHMKDVQTVFAVARGFGFSAFFGGLAILIGIAIFLKRESVRVLAWGGIFGTGVLLAVGAILGGAMAINFDAAFTVFHEIFFPQGNWQFGFDSRMLMILPENLFSDAAIIVLASGVVFACVFAAAGITGIRLTRR
jgi:integral membrane protein (TIGR01906 family)